MTAHIQIGDIRPRIQYVGTGVQTVFPYPFPIFTQDDLRVYLDDTQVTSGFAVDGEGTSDGGTVTFVEAPAAGTRVTLLRHLDIARVTDFQAGGPLRAATLNDALDHMTAVDQQLDDGLRRTVRLSPGAAEDADLTLPAPAPGAILGWNETGTALTNDPLHTDGLTDAVATVMAAGGVAAAALDHADRAETWADDAALSAWLTTLNGGGGGGGGGVGPGDDITVASVTTSGNVTIGGALVVGGSTMTVWGRSIIASANAAAGRTALGLGSAATTDSGDFASAAQGTLADSAVQPGDLGTLATQDADGVAITGGAVSGTTINGLMLPSTLGTSGNVLTSDGAGGVDWETPASGGAIVSTDITDSTAAGRSVLTGNAAAGRTALGLGSAAQSDTGDFEAAGSVTTHEGTYDHGNLPTDSEIAAIQGANSPNAGNVFATMADLGAAGGGTVTSVSITGGDGIEIDSGSPITTSGTIALGVNASALRTHINVENGATADQTAQEIVTAIDADATAENALKSALGLGSAAYTPTTNYATAAQGALADSAVQPGDIGTLAAQDADSVTITGGAVSGTTINGLTLPSSNGTSGHVLTSDGLGGVDWVAPASGGVIVSTDITDSTPTGRSVLTGDAATGRSALGLGSAATAQAGDFATALQGQTADTAIQPGDNAALALIDYTLGRFTVTAASVGATHTVALTDGELQPLTLGGNTAFTLPDPPSGRGYSVTLKLIQDATGSRTPTFAQADATAARWVGGSAPTWQTATGAFDLVVLTHDGVDLIAAHIGGVS